MGLCSSDGQTESSLCPLVPHLPLLQLRGAHGRAQHIQGMGPGGVGGLVAGM